MIASQQTHTSEQKQTNARMPRHSLVPALGLFFLAPLVGEFLLGNLPITSLGLLAFLAPLYGGGALLIRESVRRWRLGWPSMIVLCFVYGLVEEAFVTQSLFNPNYVGLRLLDYGYISRLGVSAWWTVFVLSIHAIWSTAVPIALVESFTSGTRRTPWLGYVGLAITAVLYIMACALLFVFQRQDSFRASNAQFLMSAIAVVLLIAFAIGLGRIPRNGPGATQTAPTPWVVGAVAFGLGSAFMGLARIHAPLPAALNVAGLLILLAAGSLLFWRWSNRADWSAQHGFALAGGLLLTYAWYGFVQTPSTGDATPLMDNIGNAVFAISAILLLVIGGKRVTARHDEDQPVEG